MKLPPVRKTWKQKIGVRLLEHVKETTSYCTLREVKSNLFDQRERNLFCTECNKIAKKLAL